MSNLLISGAFTLILIFMMGVTMIPGVSSEPMTNTTSNGTLDVKLDVDDSAQAGVETKLKIEFLNPQTNSIQEHIDYTINITNNGNSIFGPIPLTHTSPGSVSIPVVLENGTNKVTLTAEGILFRPIPPETVTFDIMIGEQQTQENIDEHTNENDDSSDEKVPSWIKSNAEWWANNLIDDETFVSGIQFLITEKIISVSSSSNTSSNTENDEIPKWIKNNADWWSKDLISDDDFLKGIEFLVGQGIISIPSQQSELKSSLNIGGVDLLNASPILGSEDASVTIIEFGDYQCPNCKKWFENTKPEIVTNYLETGKANLYFVDLPFLGDDSLPASSATYCANDQGLYWEYHSHLYANQRGIDSGWANESSLQNYAELLGLDTSEFTNCLDSGKYEESALFNLDVGIQNGVESTPWFIIVGSDGQKQSIKGPQPFPVFEAVIEPMLE